MHAPQKPDRPRPWFGFWARTQPDASPTKRDRLPEPLGFSLRLNLWYTLFFVFGAFLLFLLAYLLLARELREIDRELVRAKLEAYRAWYIQGGPLALQQNFQKLTGLEQE